jgi:hypothetical protein
MVGQRTPECAELRLLPGVAVVILARRLVSAEPDLDATMASSSRALAAHVVRPGGRGGQHFVHQGLLRLRLRLRVDVVLARRLQAGERAVEIYLRDV